MPKKNPNHEKLKEMARLAKQLRHPNQDSVTRANIQAVYDQKKKELEK